MTEAPLRIDNPDSAKWDDAADIVVVGFGGAGAAAAIEARQQGVIDVLALDQFSGGGATARSGGINYAGHTRFQKEGGVEDTPEEMFNFLWAEGVPVKPETLRRFCNECSDNMEWLAGFGVPYSGKAWHDKCALPPNGYYLYYTGNEKHPKFDGIARPAPRGHRPVVDGFGGHVHFAKLNEAARNIGVRVVPHSPVKRLVMDGHDNVIGVEVAPIPQSAWAEVERLYKKVAAWEPVSGARAEKAIAANAALEARYSERRLVRARAGVLLSTGGYIYNLDMVQRHRPEIGKAYKAVMRLGSMGCNGSGIRIGEAAGGVAEHMNRVYVGRIISPPDAQVRGLLVNAQGQRFINEDVYIGELGEALAQQAAQHSNTWLVLEAKDFWEALRFVFNPGKGMFLPFGLPTLLSILLGGTKRAGSLQALAQKCGIDFDGLKKTVGNYSAAARTGQPDPLGKNADYIHPFGDGPFYALNMAIDNMFSFTPSFSLGGLRVDEDSGAVLRKDGSAINGLYAAGRAAVGLCTLGYQSGMSIADTVFSGRRAGRALAQRIAQRKAA
jgi:3-oxo-5alpha-steroid 4-dehydrogenase